jgi:hypothetical protein
MTAREPGLGPAASKGSSQCIKAASSQGFVAIRCASRSGSADLGRRPSLYDAEREQSNSRDRQGVSRPDGHRLITPGHWVIGALVNNQWSVAGDPKRNSVNAFLAQPFVNYNVPGGWYLTTAPVMMANWLAPAGQKSTVPVGGGFGRVFKAGGQAFNASISAYDNVVHPTGAADWQLRALALLFPK